MAEYVEEKYAKEVLEIKDSFGGFDSLIPPEDGGIYINNKGAVLTSVFTLMKIWEHPEMKERVLDNLVDAFIGEHARKEQENE